MKFTVIFITILSISSTWGVKPKAEDPKDKREAPTGTYLPPQSSPTKSYQGPALSQEEANAISIGAGYSVGGAKPSYSFGGQGSGASYQIQAEGPANGHSNIQLSPLTLQASHGALVSNDLSQLMSQLSHGINSGAIALPASAGQGGLYQFGGQGGYSGQEIAIPQFSYGSPKLQQYSLGEQGQGGQVVPTYAIGTKGLGTYGSTGPVLFAPESTATSQPAFNYAVPSGHSFEGAALPLGDSGHSLAGLSFGGSGQSLGGSGQSFEGSLKGLNNYAAPGKSSFKPSTFLGSSVQSDVGNSLAGLSGSYSSPSLAAYQSTSGGHGGASLGSGGHGLSFGSLSGYGGGSSKQIAPTYLSPKDGFGSVESIAAAFSASGQLGPHSTTYSSPSGAYSGNIQHHAASAPRPAYYVTSSKHAPSFGSGSSSFRGPVSGHNSFSSGPKYSFGGHSSHFGSPKDAQGAYSENTYNTIKYSEELKPRFN